MFSEKFLASFYKALVVHTFMGLVVNRVYPPQYNKPRKSTPSGIHFPLIAVVPVSQNQTHEYVELEA